MLSNKEASLKYKAHLKQCQRSLKLKKSIWKGSLWKITGQCKRLTNVNRYQ